jgi:hypothetical protein
MVVVPSEKLTNKPFVQTVYADDFRVEGKALAATRDIHSPRLEVSWCIAHASDPAV